ncbi:MAG: hypothetical protein QGH15_21305 [Kiritimatiellia bacterium]|nr:hypothetical protein [Kiritimatiellia bacterium]
MLISSVVKFLLSAAVCGGAFEDQAAVSTVLAYVCILAELASEFGSNVAKDYDVSLRRFVSSCSGQVGKYFRKVQQNIVDKLANQRRLASGQEPGPGKQGDEPEGKRLKVALDKLKSMEGEIKQLKAKGKGKQHLSQFQNQNGRNQQGDNLNQNAGKDKSGKGSPPAGGNSK